MNRNFFLICLLGNSVGEQKIGQKLNDGLKNKTGIICFTYLST